MEGKQPRPANNRNGAPETTRCGVVILTICYFCLAGISSYFLVSDVMQSGSIKYRYGTSNKYENSVLCGYKTIIINCNLGSICNDIQGVSYNEYITFNRKQVNPSYNESDANIYYICTYIACIVPYMLLSLMWLLRRDANTKQCGFKQKHKCLILCFLSMIASIIAVTFGITLSVNKQNCSDGLYEYIESRIGESTWNQYYEWIEESPQMEYGSTLIFMMVTCVITLFFTFYCIRCSNTRYHKVKKRKNKYTLLAEGIEERLSIRRSQKYGTATSEKVSINLNDEGDA